MGDKQLTLLRRKHIGFVFQAFNLVPTLTAEENITLPLSIAGRKIDRACVDSVIDARRASTTAARTARPSCPAASSSAWPWPGRSCPSRPCCSPTSPPATSTRTSSAEVLDLLREASSVYGQTIVMVTHDPVAAEAADRVIHLDATAAWRRSS